MGQNGTFLIIGVDRAQMSPPKIRHAYSTSPKPRESKFLKKKMTLCFFGLSTPLFSIWGCAIFIFSL